MAAPFPRPITHEVNERGCHICTSHSIKNGYPCIGGVIAGKRRPIRLSRHLYERAFGPIPEGLVVRHTCDDPRCINLEHLLLGTHADNKQDSIDRGRVLRGEQVGRAILTDRAVRAIRNSKEAAAKLARAYGVGPAAIYSVRHGGSWKHVGGPLWERPDQTPATVTPEELRSIRRAARVSLRDLAEALGVEHSFISRIETGGRGFYRPFEEQALAAIERLRRHEPRRRKVYVGKPEDSEFLARVRAALAEGEPLPRVASTVGYKSVAGMAYRLRNLGIPFFPARGTRALSMLLAEDRQPAGVAP